MQKAALYTSGVIFAAGAVAHLVRLIAGIEIVVGEVVAPVRCRFPACSSPLCSPSGCWSRRDARRLGLPEWQAAGLPVERASVICGA